VRIKTANGFDWDFAAALLFTVVAAIFFAGLFCALPAWLVVYIVDALRDAAVALGA